MLVLLAYAIEDSTDIFRISGGGLNTPNPPLGTPLVWMNIWYPECNLINILRINKYTENKLCTNLALFTRLYWDARPTKHKT